MVSLQCNNCVIHTWALQRRASHNGVLYKSSFLYRYGGRETAMERKWYRQRLLKTLGPVTVTVLRQWLDMTVGFDPGISSTAFRHVTTRPLRPVISVGVLKESPCPWESLRTNLQVLVLVTPWTTSPCPWTTKSLTTSLPVIIYYFNTLVQNEW